MKGDDPFIIFLVLFILFGLAYGPLRKTDLNKSSNNGLNTSSSIGATNDNSEYSSNDNVAKSIKEAEREIKRLEKNLREEIDRSKRSPYYDKIRMSNISGLGDLDPSREYISLYVNLEKNETVKITDWYLKSEVTGYYVVIGKAALLPFPFTRIENDVVLQQGDRVYLTKGFSPIGISFRTNKCAGYFEENRTFTPSLSFQCPRPEDEKLPSFSSTYDGNDECLGLIKNISRCSTASGLSLRDLPDTVTQSCKTYLTTQINYNSCVAKHFGDTDFPGDEYRLYLKKFGPLWRNEHDIINLHDENGLIVDTISY